MKTRREILQRGAVASTAPLLMRVSSTRAQPDGDDADAVALVNLVAAEQETLRVYREGDGVFDGRAAEFARAFNRQARERVELLQEELAKLRGGESPRLPPVAEDLANVRSGEELLEVAIRREAGAVAAYHREIARITSVQLLKAAATAMAAHGRNLALLRREAGRNPLPAALEKGE